MFFLNIVKSTQKNVYNALSRKYPFVYTIVLIFLFLSTLGIYLGEWWMLWNKEKYNSLSSPYTDNILTKSLQHQLCQKVPIDVVYTWVNGSDPILIKQIAKYRDAYYEELSKHCPYTNCVPSHVVTLRSWQTIEIQQNILGLISFLSPKHLEKVSVPTKYREYTPNNWTLIYFHSVKQAFEASQISRNSELVLFEMYNAHWTTDANAPNLYTPCNAVIMSNLPLSILSIEEVNFSKYLSIQLGIPIKQLWFYPEKKLAVVVLFSDEAVDKFLKDSINLVLDYSLVNVTRAYLILELPHLEQLHGFSPSRFDDKEELRYSLRSLEKFAPWIRHVFLVTNGQIPYWLNLDNPRLTLVTHEEIFVNLSHLPTFSSPAIETHIHRIHGLSQKFLYLNDDVMLGKEVWPEDFETFAKGQKVYLSWSVPDCSDSCPWSWIGDGACDHTCNNLECTFDGGDCDLNENEISLYDDINVAGYVEEILKMDHIVPKESQEYLFNVEKDINQIHLSNKADRVKRFLDVFKQKEIDIIHRNNITGPSYTIINNNKKNNLTGLNPVSVLSKAHYYTVVNSTHANYEKHIKANDISIKFRLVAKTKTFQYPRSLFLKINNFKNFVSKEYVFFLKTLQIASENSTIRPNLFIKQSKLLYKSFKDLRRDILRYLQKNDKLLVENLLENILTDNINDKKIEINPQDFYNMQVIKLLQNVMLLYKSSKYIFQNFIENSNLSQQKRNGKKIINNNKSFTSKNMQAKTLNVLDHHKENLRINFSSLYNNISISKIEKLKSNYKAKNETLKENTLKNKSFHRQKRGLLFFGFRNESKLFDTNKLMHNIKAKLDQAAENQNFLSRNLLQHNISTKPDEHTQKKTFMQNKIANKSLSNNQNLKKLYKSLHKRKSVDNFAASLIHVNKLLNEKYGFEVRKVPAHMPHLIDREIMENLQERFENEWEQTSAHKVRSSSDMQFAFSYFYFLMSEKEKLSITDIFDTFDTDKSGTWSDREIRTILTRIYDLPLSYANIINFESEVCNCSLGLENDMSISTPPYERYEDSKLPVVTKYLISNCQPITTKLLAKFGTRKKYKYEVIKEKHQDVVFKMLNSNLSQLIASLDEVRKTPKKFICLNDNLNPDKKKENTLLRAILQDFYESLLPSHSSFELPSAYRNRFLHITELNSWHAHRNIIKSLLYICVTVLVLFTVYNFLYLKCRPRTKKHYKSKHYKSKHYKFDV